MMFKYTKLALLSGAAMLVATEAMAVASNNPPPAGPVILNLDGTTDFGSYHLYTASFIATSGTTNLSFAIREDPAFISLDDITMVDLTTASGNLVTNGDFESGIVGNNAPVNWTYLNIFGASFAGAVNNNNPHSGSNNYYDGAVQAYDAITQAIATTPGDLYQVQFWEADNSGAALYSALSTNGDVTDTGGNGINVVVYAGALPTPADAPEPASVALIGAGLGGIGWIRRKRK